MELLCFDTPWGAMGLAEEAGAICRLYLPNSPLPRIRPFETPLLRTGRQQLAAYFAGERLTFSLPLAPQGTPFQQAVWSALAAIPPGETRSYSQIAAAAGSPRACRAAGAACRCNPIPILIPCHRVIGLGGALTGYGGGLPLKRALLALERGHRPEGPRP